MQHFFATGLIFIKKYIIITLYKFFSWRAGYEKNIIVFFMCHDAFFMWK